MDDATITEEDRHPSAHTYLPADTTSQTHGIPRTDYDPYRTSPSLLGLSPSFRCSTSTRFPHDISSAHPLGLPHDISSAHSLGLPQAVSSLPLRRSQDLFFLPPSLSQYNLERDMPESIHPPEANRFGASGFLRSVF